MDKSELVKNSLSEILAELINGTMDKQFAWVLNPDSQGLLDLLKQLDVSQALATRIPGRASIAAHTNHVRFSLEFLNRKSEGEEPFNDEDWDKSWQIQLHKNEEWLELLDQLDKEARLWMKNIHNTQQEWSQDTVTEMIASATHVAYHCGAIRQILGTVNNSS